SYIHRDIKGENILVKGESGSGAVTDFGSLTPKKKQPHLTRGTELYLDPAQFGSPGSSLWRQKLRIGIQNQEADILALGRVIERDGLEHLLRHLAEKNGKTAEIKPLLDKIKPQMIPGPFTDQRLREQGLQHPYRAIYFVRSTPASERLFIYNPLQERQYYVDGAIDSLKEHFSDAEFQALKRLVSLAYSMQAELPHQRPDANEVAQELVQLCLRVQTTENTRGGVARRLFDDPSDDETTTQPVSRRREGPAVDTRKRKRHVEPEEASSIPSDECKDGFPLSVTVATKKAP
ncbi:MAG: hypothetical protein K1000chlam4_00611, partial [Chlamydiae bacterium]|nr:hypothetical protein [Chlamydiota bacterium]